MISQEKKIEIVSMWKNGLSISQIAREVGVSRPTVRKVVEEYKENRSWFLTRTYNQPDYVRLIVNTFHTRPRRGLSDIEYLALGVEHYEVNNLIRKIVKKETADKIMYEFERNPPSISIVHIKKTEIKPGVKI